MKGMDINDGETTEETGLDIPHRRDVLRDAEISSQQRRRKTRLNRMLEGLSEEEQCDLPLLTGRPKIKDKPARRIPKERSHRPQREKSTRVLSTRPRRRLDLSGTGGGESTDLRRRPGLLPNELGPEPGWTLKQYAFILENLREVRESCGISMLAFSRRLGVGPTPTRRWELYGAHPQVVTLAKIGAVLNALKYFPIPDPDGWTIKRALEQIPLISSSNETCRALQVSDQTIRHWRNGRLPNFQTLLRIEEFFSRSS